MTENLAKHFVGLRVIGLASDSLSELGFNHGEHRLDVAALVVVLFELGLLELVEVIHALPQFALTRRVRLVLFAFSEGDVRDAALDERKAAITKTVVALIG